MEGPVNGMRETFIRDLTKDYLEEQKRSFLYRAFWCENMNSLLETHFPGLLEQGPSGPEDEGQIRNLLSSAMKERPGWVGDLPLRKQEWKLRRDFWEELWLNDAGYRAKLIEDTEYYLWLVQYLAAHDVYYKTNIYYGCGTEMMTRTGHKWLYGLLTAGLGMDLSELKREIKALKKARREEHKKAPKKAETNADSSAEEAGAGLSKADVEEALTMLEEQIHADRDKIARRLHGLKCSKRAKDGTIKKLDYLPWLTERLKWMALHIKIKNWLQDSGYPLVRTEKSQKGMKKARRRDFTMRLFEEYYSEADYELLKRTGDWRLSDRGFCVLDTGPDRLEALLKALEAEQDEDPYLYIPLAVHVHSGCVFFLAGKASYQEAYQKAGGKWEAIYQGTQARYCFDYLRLVKYYSGELPGGGVFCLGPTFHRHPAVRGKAGKHYKDALTAFEKYCKAIDGASPLLAVRDYNGERPAGIPEAFQWAFS